MRVKSPPIQIKITRLGHLLIYASMIIVGRLAYLQIHLSQEFLTQSRRNFLRTKTINPPRGNIVDINHKLLVTNRPVVNLYWKGAAANPDHQEIAHAISELTMILKESLIDPENIFTHIKRANRGGQKHLIAQDLSFEQLSQIKELFANHENLIVETDFERLYPHDAYASHILGYLGRINVDKIGKMGLEELLEESLKGNPGTLQTTINSLGTQLSHVELKRAFSGSTIHTTIDLSLQHIAESVFPAENAGSIIVMNPVNGAIHALVSRPNFDPNMFIHPMTSEKWQELQANRPFLNRAFKACYPPGSIFKLVTCSAALELGLMTPTTTNYCPGYYTFKGRQYRCSQRHGHGQLNAEQALAQSCNILFFDIGKRIDIDILAHYAHIFGLGEKTNVLFSESCGVIPSHAWKKAVKGEKWWPGETLSAAIGQSFLLVTPIQVARMISSIFTGYLVTPRILVNEPVITKPLDIKPKTLSFLRETMRLVVTQGTGRRVSLIKDMEVYGKTSTAQVSSLDKRENGTANLEHGWFVEYVRYKDQTPLTIVIMLENVGSSRVATAAARKFLIEYKALMDKPKSGAMDNDNLS